LLRAAMWTQYLAAASWRELMGWSKSLRDQCHSDMALDLGDELCSRLHRKLIGTIKTAAVDRERA